MADFLTKLANLRPKIAKNSHDGGKKLSYWQVDYVGVQNFCVGVKNGWFGVKKLPKGIQYDQLGELVKNYPFKNISQI